MSLLVSLGAHGVPAAVGGRTTGVLIGLVVGGGIVGLATGLFRVGGGGLAKPLLWIVGIGAVPAIGTTVPAIVVMSANASPRTVLRRCRSYWGLIAAGAAAGAVAAVALALATKQLPGHGHWQNFAAGVLIAGTVYWWRPDNQARLIQASTTSGLARRPKAQVGVLAGLFAGATVGAVGLGGGIFVLPLVLACMPMELESASLASSCIVGISAIAAMAAQGSIHLIDWTAAVALAAGMVIGKGASRFIPAGKTLAAAQAYGMLVFLCGVVFAVSQAWFAVSSS